MAKYTYQCKDLGLNCSFKISGNEKEGLLKKILDHAKVAHNIRENDIETLNKLRAAIRESAA